MFKSTNLDQFTFPFVNFTKETYRYSNDLVNLPEDKANFMKITPEYEVQIKWKRKKLDEQKEVRFQSFPHTLEMQWELVDMLSSMAVDRYPEHFSLEKNGNHWVFENKILNEK